MILVIDNYDSFVHNLARYVRLTGNETVVARNDELDSEGIRKLAPRAILISPGPCTPNQAGNSLEIISAFCESTPILGICLGHQAIVQHFGGHVVRSDSPTHGRSSPISHDGRGVFSGLPNPLFAGRYHSLVADPDRLPDCLELTSQTSDGVIMSVRHRELPVVGLQFHPESILTEHGFKMLKNFFGEPVPR